MLKDDLILVTGSAGFIGYSVSKKLLEQGHKVIGIDCFSPYYDVTLKNARNNILLKYPDYSFKKMDLCNLNEVKELFSSNNIRYVCHLAAQAGVRYSISHPYEYQKFNLEGFTHIIEEAKNSNKIKNFVYASSSSVYGGNEKLPFSETDSVDKPLALYGATKRANELIAYSYSHLFKLPCTGLRFFTVYGPFGRPDMALFLFTKAIIEGKPIDVYNHGNMKRSFTYIDDIVDGVIAAIKNPFQYEIFNLGNDKSETLMRYIEIIEKEVEKKSVRNLLPLQPGDVLQTYADISHAGDKLGFAPKTNIEEGIKCFVKWYREYYKV
ncbi:MAG: hypothetical protein ACD_79C01218G0001 [uncultured bacterium]|nr:MAG: hypothetical protein ACD_79C01218G0001 [uncultured bacterium]